MRHNGGVVKHSAYRSSFFRGKSFAFGLGVSVFRITTDQNTPNKGYRKIKYKHAINNRIPNNNRIPKKNNGPISLTQLQLSKNKYN